PVLAVVGGLGQRVPLLDDRRQHATPHLGERGADARRHLVLRRVVVGVGVDHRLDRLLRVAGSSQRQQTKRTVLLDGARIDRRRIAVVQAVQQRQRFVIRRRRVEVARRDQIVALCVGAGVRQQARCDEGCYPGGRVQRFHFFLMSTLRRAGAVRETVALWRCSPRSGWRNRTSCVPMVTWRLPMGVSPIFSPSTQTSAHGIAFSAIVPFGKSTLTDATLPGETCTVFQARNPSASLTISSSCRPADTITRSLRLVPISCFFSKICISAGAESAIQPDTGAPSGALSGTVSDAVLPASIVTTCFTDPRSLSSCTACSPGVRSAIVSGALPLTTPSTLTRAPAGS